MVKKYKLKEIDHFLKTEKNFLNVVECHFLESASRENLGVNSNRVGNSIESSLIKKMEDPEYVKAKLVIDSINELRSNCNAIEEDLLYYWAQRDMKYFEIGRKIKYSQSYVKQNLLRLRHSLVAIMNKKVAIMNKNIGGDGNE